MAGSYLGPSYAQAEIEERLSAAGAAFERCEDDAVIARTVDGLVADVVKRRRRQMSNEEQSLFGIDKLNVPRSDIPAVTHVDYSARVQTVHRETNPRFHALLSAFKAATGCPVLVNTSFNVRGEPIVCTPQDAYRCFLATDMDALVLEDAVVHKEDVGGDAGAIREEYLAQFQLD